MSAVDASAPIRVLHVAAPGRAGGLESVVRQLTAALRAGGHDARVAAVLPSGLERAHPFLEGLQQAGVPVDVIAVRGREYRAERRAVRAVIEAHRVQIVHTHGYRPDVLHGRLAQSMGRAHATTLHGFIGGTRRGRFYEWLQVRAAVRADVAIAVSAPIVARLQKAGAGTNIRLIPNALGATPDALSRDEARQALGLAPDATLVGWVGRVSPEKGPDLFVRALARTDRSVQGVMVGDGSALSSVRALAQSLGVAERLHCVGLVPAASRFLAAFDVLALTSRTEGTPMILLEAMWASVPIVATAVGGVPDLLGRDAAALCPPDDVEALGQAMQQLLTHRAAASACAAAARARVASDYAPDRWVASYIESYAQLLRRRSRLQTSGTG